MLLSFLLIFVSDSIISVTLLPIFTFLIQVSFLIEEAETGWRTGVRSFVVFVLNFMIFRIIRLYFKSVKSKASEQLENIKTYSRILNSLNSGVVLYSDETFQSVEFCNLKFY